MTETTQLEMSPATEALRRIEDFIKEKRKEFTPSKGKNPNIIQARELEVSRHLLQSAGTLASFDGERLESQGYRDAVLAAATLLTGKSLAGLAVPENIRGSEVYKATVAEIAGDRKLTAKLHAISNNVIIAQERSGEPRESLLQVAKRIFSELGGTHQQTQR
jgi:hypothetical protein